ncbi:MAG: PAC2 family protein [Thermoproteota archaeon]|jgi:Archaeal enzymes of ATP-grasp superfamily
MKIVILKENQNEKNNESIFKDKIFITGFHGVGAVGYLTSKYLSMQKKAEFIGYVTMERLPMIIRMEDDRIGLPFELYSFDNFIVLVNEAMPETKHVYTYTNKIAKWVIKSGFKMAVLFGGLAERVKEGSDIRIAYTSQFKSIMQPFAPTLEKKLSIIGPLALLLAKFEEMKFPAVCILPYARVYEYDLKAAHKALKILIEQFKAELDLTKIEQDLALEKKLELDIAQQLEKIKQQPPPDSKILYM